MGRKEDQIKHAAKITLFIFAQKLSEDLGMEPTFEEACTDAPVISKNGMSTIPVDINNVERISFDFKTNEIIFSKSHLVDNAPKFSTN
jgi:hypothetical protein